MKLLITFLALSMLFSCGQVQRILDGTEKLPSQIQETNAGMKKTNEGIRMQKIGEAFKVMSDENNRKTLSPIPSNMMAAAKIMAEALTAEEAVLFVKNYVIKVNEEIFTDTYPWIDEESDAGIIEKAKFMLNKAADLQMITLVSGFLPDETLKQIIEEEGDQGAYRDMQFAILKMRSTFYSDVMLDAGLIGGGKKLETLGQIEKASEYADKIDFICKLDFADQISMKITGFDEKLNERLSMPLEKSMGLALWKRILEKAQLDFKAQSFSKDPAKKEEALKQYAIRYKSSLEKIQSKISAYAQPKN